MLLAIFSCKAAQDILKTKGIKKMAETLLLYSHRHYDRLSRLLQVQCKLLTNLCENRLLTLRQSSFAVDLSLFKMAVVSPALETSADKPSLIVQASAVNAIKKKGLSIQVRSRSQSPDLDSILTLQFPEQKIAKVSAEGEQAVARKRRRA
jgi:hypothetical protein